MQSEFAANTRSNDGRLELPTAAALHLIDDAQRCSARRVFFLRVMALLDSHGVLLEAAEQLACTTRKRERDVGARRKVGGVHASDSRLLDFLANGIETIVPASCADDQVDMAIAGNGHRFVDSARAREIDQHLG